MNNDITVKQGTMRSRLVMHVEILELAYFQTLQKYQIPTPPICDFGQNMRKCSLEMRVSIF
jgi:hypothetical protein